MCVFYLGLLVARWAQAAIAVVWGLIGQTLHTVTIQTNKWMYSMNIVSTGVCIGAFKAQLCHEG